MLLFLKLLQNLIIILLKID